MAKKKTSGKPRRKPVTKPAQPEAPTAPSSAADFLLASTRLVTLPSGFVVEIQDVALHEMCAAGLLPADLLREMMRIEQGETTPETMDGDEWQALMQGTRAVAIAACVSPRFVADRAEQDADNNVLYVGVLSDSDLFALSDLSKERKAAEVEKMSRFREGGQSEAGHS